MCSARSAVEAVGDSIKFVLAVDRQIGALGQVLTPQDVPVIQRPGVRVRVPLGSIDGVRSPLTPPAEVTLLDITLEARAELALPVAAGERAFFMPIFGSGVQWRRLRSRRPRCPDPAGSNRRDNAQARGHCWRSQGCRVHRRAATPTCSFQRAHGFCERGELDGGNLRLPPWRDGKAVAGRHAPRGVRPITT
jgi:hypothetical protein